MQYNVLTTKRFEDDIEFYYRKKKFKHIYDDVEKIISDLEKGNLIGVPIQGLSFGDNQTIKVRIINSDTKSGKSNGYRMIYYVIKSDYEIYLLTIYYKKDDNNIPGDKEIEDLIKEYCL